MGCAWKITIDKGPIADQAWLFVFGHDLCGGSGTFMDWICCGMSDWIITWSNLEARSWVFFCGVDGGLLPSGTMLPWERVLCPKQCSGFYGSVNFHMNVRTQGFLLEHVPTATRWWKLFSSLFSCCVWLENLPKGAKQLWVTLLHHRTLIIEPLLTSIIKGIYWPRLWSWRFSDTPMETYSCHKHSQDPIPIYTLYPLCPPSCVSLLCKQLMCHWKALLKATPRISASPTCLKCPLVTPRQYCFVSYFLVKHRGLFYSKK